jgi:hypothetical protein
MKTRVIFRKFREKGEVIALFPDEQADNNTLNCLSYMHEGIGYDLRVGKRITNRRTA